MDVAAAAGLNLRARDAQEARTAAMSNAVNALGQGASAYAEGQDLYKKTKKTNDPVIPPVTGGVAGAGYGTVLSPPQGGFALPQTNMFGNPLTENPYSPFSIEGMKWARENK